MYIPNSIKQTTAQEIIIVDRVREQYTINWADGDNKFLHALQKGPPPGVIEGNIKLSILYIPKINTQEIVSIEEALCIWILRNSSKFAPLLIVARGKLYRDIMAFDAHLRFSNGAIFIDDLNDVLIIRRQLGQDSAPTTREKVVEAVHDLTISKMRPLNAHAVFRAALCALQLSPTSPVLYRYAPEVKNEVHPLVFEHRDGRIFFHLLPAISESDLINICREAQTTKPVIICGLLPKPFREQLLRMWRDHDTLNVGIIETVEDLKDLAKTLWPKRTRKHPPDTPGSNGMSGQEDQDECNTPVNQTSWEQGDDGGEGEYYGREEQDQIMHFVMKGRRA